MYDSELTLKSKDSILTIKVIGHELNQEGVSQKIKGGIKNATRYTLDGRANGWLDGDNTLNSGRLASCKDIRQAYGFNATSRGGSSGGGIGLLGGCTNERGVGGGGGMIGGIATDEGFSEWK